MKSKKRMALRRRRLRFLRREIRRMGFGTKNSRVEEGHLSFLLAELVPDLTPFRTTNLELFHILVERESRAVPLLGASQYKVKQRQFYPQAALHSESMPFDE